MVQPDLFSELDLEASMREFYAELYGIDGPAFDTLVAPTLAGDFPGGTP
jgi:hypothetical protein